MKHYISGILTLLILVGVVVGQSVETPVKTDSPAKVKTPKDRVYFVRDFGATGDGNTLDTKAIQQAIDTCSTAGGGLVRFCTGTYLTGTIFLKSGVYLYLDHDATILGSTDQKDYPSVNHYGDAKEISFQNVNMKHISYLIYANNVKHTGIKGEGTINGSGRSFWDGTNPIGRHNTWRPKAWRPRSLICIVRSQFLTFRDFTIVDSPAYSIWTMKSEDIQFDSLTIRNPVFGPNTDGLDIDSCKRVTVSNCNIIGGDDAIALKSDSGVFDREEFHCEDICVTNCVLCAGPACGVRIGYEGDSIIRNCTFSNLTIWNSDKGLDIVSILPTGQVTIKNGTRVENITFDNITMRDVGNPIHFWLTNHKKTEKPDLYLRNIRVSNVIAECNRGCSIIGNSDKKIENISLSNIHLIHDGEGELNVPTTAEPSWSSFLPYALYCDKVDRVRVDNFTVDWSRSSGFWKYSLFFIHCNEIDLSNVSAWGYNKVVPRAVIGLNNSQGRIRFCNTDDGMTLVDAKESSHFYQFGNDTARNSSPYTIDSTSSMRR